MLLHFLTFGQFLGQSEALCENGAKPLRRGCLNGIERNRTESRTAKHVDLGPFGVFFFPKTSGRQSFGAEKGAFLGSTCVFHRPRTESNGIERNEKARIMDLGGWWVVLAKRQGLGLFFSFWSPKTQKEVRKTGKRANNHRAAKLSPRTSGVSAGEFSPKIPKEKFPKTLPSPDLWTPSFPCPQNLVPLNDFHLVW